MAKSKTGGRTAGGARRSAQASVKKASVKKASVKKASVKKASIKKTQAKRKAGARKPASNKPVARTGSVSAKRPAARKPATRKSPAKAASTKRSAKKSGAMTMPRAPGRRALEIAEEVFRGLGWGTSSSDDGINRWDVNIAPEDHFEIVVQLIGDEQLVLYLVFRERVPPERLSQVLEMIARVNHGLLIGGYEIDLDEGFVRLKVSLDFKGAPLDPRLISNLVTGAHDVSDVYDDAILDVIHGVASAREALEQVEPAE